MLTYLVKRTEAHRVALLSTGLQSRILTCLFFCASGKLSSEHDLHDGRQGNIGLCPWQTLARHSPRPTQRRAIITRHGNNQLVKQEEAARGPLCAVKERWRMSEG